MPAKSTSNQLLRALFGVVGLGRVEFYSTPALDAVDSTISKYPSLDSRAGTCGIGGLPPVSTVLDNLEAIKGQISANHVKKLAQD